MLDVNLYTLNFIQSSNEIHKLVLIEEGSGEPVYYRTLTNQESSTDSLKLNLFHSLTHAHLASLETLNQKLKLISLWNPNQSFELKNSRLKSNKKGLGYTCWLARKPDPDYPCAIYKPSTSTLPASCQILDFNIRRIEGIEDKKGLEIVMIISLLAFTEVFSDHHPRQPKPSNSPDRTPSHQPTLPIRTLRPKEVSRILKDEVEPNEILIHEDGTIDEFIKRIRFKDFKEDLQQYLIDEIMSRNLKHESNPIQSKLSKSSSTNKTLKIYLSRTSLDELLPKAHFQSNPHIKSPVLPPKLFHSKPSFKKPI
ncbi:hypothetical protein DFH28DRAFT_1078984 [Melampsora americana]|nr:hypothetical protein DFH28DRAFT_1078984 [Melampsora americana]